MYDVHYVVQYVGKQNNTTERTFSLSGLHPTSLSHRVSSLNIIFVIFASRIIMVGWEAANLTHGSRGERKLSSQEEEEDTVYSGQIISKRDGETPDAALARLTEFYSAAMDAISGVHKISRMLIKSTVSVDGKTDHVEPNKNAARVENMDCVIQRASKAARVIIEHGILSDPMVRNYIHIVPRVLSQEGIISIKDYERFLLDKPRLSSVAQRNTLKRYVDLDLDFVCTQG